MNGQDELRDLWCSQRSSKTTGGEDMLALVQRRTSHFDRWIAVRNGMECVAAGAVVAMFGPFAFLAHNALFRAGCAVIAASAAWIAFYILRYGHGPSRVDPSLNLKGFTDALVSRYDYQIRLLKSVKYWYLLPPYLGLLLRTAGILQERQRAGVLSWIDFIWPAAYTAAFGAVWWLNEVYSVGRLEKERGRLLSMTSETDNFAD